MKKLVLSAVAAAFVLGIGGVAFTPVKAFAADQPKVDCTKKENADNPACKKK
jgi:hypothetical protein